MIHLIGVNHLAQRFKSSRGPSEQNLSFTDDQIKFKDAIEKAIRDLKPDLLAEEDNQERLDKAGSISILQAIHKIVGIRHEFVDPNKAERNARGYKDYVQLCKFEQIRSPLVDDDNLSEVEMLARAHEIAHQFPIRERFWLAELRRIAAQKILFVCGDIHLCTFGNLLAAELIAFSVFAEGIGVNPSNKIEYDALEYAKDNHMFDDADCFCLQNDESSSL
jgi:hypothetical protein